MKKNSKKNLKKHSKNNIEKSPKWNFTKIIISLLILLVVFAICAHVLQGDFPYFLKIWFGLLFLGISAFPITSKIFVNFKDRGWFFSKIIASALFSWLIWLLSYSKFISYSTTNCYIMISVVALAGYIPLIIKQKKEKFLKADQVINTFFYIVFTEVVFLSVFCLWTYIKCYSPSINNHIEQFMDYGYMNALMKSSHMPPEDIWLSGKTINYYYFGQFISGFICKVSGLTAKTGYNLILALVASTAFVAPFEFGYNLFKTSFKNKFLNILLPLLVAIFMGVGTSFGGTLHYPIYHWIIPDETYTYIDETRYIGFKPDIEDKAVTEVPAYSAMIGDLHAHYFVIILSFMSLALLIEYWHSNQDEFNIKSFVNSKILILGILLGIQQMSNIWSLPIYGVIISITIIAKNLILNKFTKKNFLKTILLIAEIFALETLASLPFTLDLEVSVVNICLAENHSQFYKLAVKWGFQTICALLFLIIYLIKFKMSKLKFKEYLNENKTDLYFIMLSCCAFGLVLIPELFYLKDIYGIEFHRFNTMFKLTYEAFLLYSITTNYFIYKFLTAKKHYVLTILSLTLVIIEASTFGYAYTACHFAYQYSTKGSITDVYSYMNAELPYDYLAIEWINENIPKDKVILEVASLNSSYTTYGRIAVFTGNPTVLGWSAHEWIWRYAPDYTMPKIISDREAEIRAFYTETDLEKAKQFLKKYNVSYIMLGDKEYTTFYLDADFIKSLGEVVYNYGYTHIIKVDPSYLE